MLALLVRDAEPSIELLRRRQLVSTADRNSFDAWSQKLTQQLSSPVPEARLSACDLLAETVQQCGQADFSRHREAWTTLLLRLMQPVSSKQPGDDGATTTLTLIRLASAETLVQMVTVASGWPAERREIASVVSRVASTLIGLTDDPSAQHSAIVGLVHLCAAAPHGLRFHRERLSEVLPMVTLEAPAASARAAATLLAALPSALPDPQAHVGPRERRGDRDSGAALAQLCLHLWPASNWQ